MSICGIRKSNRINRTKLKSYAVAIVNDGPSTCIRGKMASARRRILFTFT
jgi:hypothetical protein